jgi:hypothetical protein
MATARIWLVSPPALPRVAPLVRNAYLVAAGAGRAPVVPAVPDQIAGALVDRRGPRAALLRTGATSSSSAARWALLAPPRSQARVNGLPLTAGFRVLRHQDEVLLPSVARFFFSTEVLAQIQPFLGLDGEGDACCPRCKQVLARGCASVLCPGCRVWYHASEALPCWTYSERCTCGHPTALEAGFRWVPAGI